jgi:hypothetical protein
MSATMKSPHSYSGRDVSRPEGTSSYDVNLGTSHPLSSTAPKQVHIPDFIPAATHSKSPLGHFWFKERNIFPRADQFSTKKESPKNV